MKELIINQGEHPEYSLLRSVTTKVAKDAIRYGYIDEGSAGNFNIFRSLNVVTHNNGLYYICSIIQAINEEYEARAVMIHEYSSSSLRKPFNTRTVTILDENDAVFHSGDGLNPEANKLVENSSIDFLSSVLKAKVNPELTLREFSEQKAMGATVRWPGVGEKIAIS